MPWFVVDDDMTFHPKTLAAGNEAMGLWVRAGAWCQKQMNGGFVPTEMVAALGGAELANRLVSAGLWSKNRSGFCFHQWDERQLSKEDMENRRKKRAEAGRMGGLKSGESRRRSKNEANTEALASKSHAEGEANAKQTGNPVPNTYNPVAKATKEKDLLDADASSGSPTELAAVYPKAFEEWWEHYPRKAGKRKALDAWRRARKRATDTQLIDGARRYASDPNRRDEFTKYPEGWLNRDGWLDDPLPGSKAAGGITW